MQVHIVDYGMGNIGSIVNAFRIMKVRCVVSSNFNNLKNAEYIILPGVGSFNNGMQNLNKLNLTGFLYEQIIDNQIPTLGICLGMQLLTNFSQEGNIPGLGWISGETIRFNISRADLPYRIPHMGWNSITPTQKNPILEGIKEDDRFYFVHSYHVSGIDPINILGQTKYKYSFPSLIMRKNIWGIQCHPERSHKSGLKLLKNFINV